MTERNKKYLNKEKQQRVCNTVYVCMCVCANSRSVIGTAKLSWHVQNCNLIRSSQSKLQPNDFDLEIKKNACKMWAYYTSSILHMTTPIESI